MRSMTISGSVYIHTIGCQMNTYDSGKLLTLLGNIGYAATDSLDEADIVICNTCSIREKAQEKAFSFLGRLASRKLKKPHLISIMAGCVAQQEGEAVFKRIPDLDIVLGTRAYARLPGHIQAVRAGKTRIADVDDCPEIFDVMPHGALTDKLFVSQFVTIMQGCDNYCSYCVVPYVRGRERSRSPEAILDEIRLLADQGVKEVVLLGQNVNSYGVKENSCSFPDLLRMVAGVDGILRIRFATSHPKDLSDDLIAAFRDIDKVCNHLHLPVQSGSNRILEKMNRRYTRQHYLERIDLLRKACPGIAVTSDMIVGFPSESSDDFHKTLDLVRQVEFDGLFAFAYSDRPNAPAARFSDPVPETEKLDRLNELLEVQETITTKKNQALIGSRVEVLVEGPSRKKRQMEDGDDSPADVIQWTGRTGSSKIIHFNDDTARAGDLVTIEIKDAYPHSLWGRVCQETIQG